ncbi:MAG: hypothetical protein R3B90_17960 [Planctomycetaceae bacterium]
MSGEPIPPRGPQSSQAVSDAVGRQLVRVCIMCAVAMGIGFWLGQRMVRNQLQSQDVVVSQLQQEIRALTGDVQRLESAARQTNGQFGNALAEVKSLQNVELKTEVREAARDHVELEQLLRQHMSFTRLLHSASLAEFEPYRRKQLAVPPELIDESLRRLESTQAEQQSFLLELVRDMAAGAAQRIAEIDSRGLQANNRTAAPTGTETRPSLTAAVNHFIQRAVPDPVLLDPRSASPVSSVSPQLDTLAPAAFPVGDEALSLADSEVVVIRQTPESEAVTYEGNTGSASTPPVVLDADLVSRSIDLPAGNEPPGGLSGEAAIIATAACEPTPGASNLEPTADFTVPALRRVEQPPTQQPVRRPGILSFASGRRVVEKPPAEAALPHDDTASRVTQDEQDTLVE